MYLGNSCYIHNAKRLVFKHVIDKKSFHFSEQKNK